MKIKQTLEQLPKEFGFNSKLDFSHSGFKLFYKYSITVDLNRIFSSNDELDVIDILKGYTHQVQGTSKYSLLTEKKSCHIKRVDKEISELYEMFDKLNNYLKTKSYL